MTNEYVKLFTESGIIINGLKKVLEDANIYYLIKDKFESARLGGYVEPNTSVELHVLKADSVKAEGILTIYKEKINS